MGVGSSAVPQLAETARANPPKGDTDASEFSGKRLLLVDDNDLNSMLASRLLRTLGFDVTIAENGAVAHDAFARGRFDIVLMDCQMPVLDGYAATRHIRELETRLCARRTQVIAITATPSPGTARSALAAGMDDYLGKPYSVRELRPKLSQWLAPTHSRCHSLNPLVEPLDSRRKLEDRAPLPRSSTLQLSLGHLDSEIETEWRARWRAISSW